MKEHRLNCNTTSAVMIASPGQPRNPHFSYAWYSAHPERAVVRKRMQIIGQSARLASRTRGQKKQRDVPVTLGITLISCGASYSFCFRKLPVRLSGRPPGSSRCRNARSDRGSRCPDGTAASRIGPHQSPQDHGVRPMCIMKNWSTFRRSWATASINPSQSAEREPAAAR
jgi:hypothetical protein